MTCPVADKIKGADHLLSRVRLQELHGIVQKNGHYVCLHGTDDLPDKLWRDCLKRGVTKVRHYP